MICSPETQGAWSGIYFFFPVIQRVLTLLSGAPPPLFAPVVNGPFVFIVMFVSEFDLNCCRLRQFFPFRPLGLGWIIRGVADAAPQKKIFTGLSFAPPPEISFQQFPTGTIDCPLVPPLPYFFFDVAVCSSDLQLPLRWALFRFFYPLSRCDENTISSAFFFSFSFSPPNPYNCCDGFVDLLVSHCAFLHPKASWPFSKFQGTVSLFLFFF